MDSNLQCFDNIYTVLVAGEVDMSIYNMKKKVEPYIAYKYNDRKKIRQEAIKIYKDIYDNNSSKPDFSMFNEMIRLKIEETEEMTDEEYFDVITNGMIIDKDTGDALITINPNGMYMTLTEATVETALPLKDNMFECKVKDVIDKTETIEDVEKYSNYWDKVMSIASVTRSNFLEVYKDKETYVKLMSNPFFYNAFVSKETGWVEQSLDKQIEWVFNFKDNFIDKLDENITLKVYNFTR